MTRKVKKKIKPKKANKKELKKSYQKYLYSSTNNELLSYSKKADELILKIAPKKLYKYRSCSEESIENFESNTLWLSSPQHFNDPYDFKPHMSNDGLWKSCLSTNKELNKLYRNCKSICTHEQMEEFQASIAPMIEENKKDMELKFEQFRNNICICSLSEIKDSLLMWSHYSDSYKGFCIEYDFNDMHNRLKGLLHPVFYDSKVIDIAKYTKYKNIHLLAILNKSKEWSYEDEWRIIGHDDSFKGANWPVPKPKAIYFGCNMSNLHVDRLSKIADKLDIDKYLMKMKPDKYKLVPQKI
ncbi:DUF2971 domain-containing protein [Clostridium botulinum]|uniref:DUF2971 domain-containing protein n=1 Tax=Clostridium botulinum TaxID=1491 RepID=UPI001FD65B07|nr:DUF2971 domain-containing protein [Clostridium botulinum]MCJ8173213.1 DUF2971 domain-containing protein [Clostridium botulinum]